MGTHHHSAFRQHNTTPQHNTHNLPLTIASIEDFLLLNMFESKSIAGAKARGPGSGGPGVSVTDEKEVRLTRGDSRVSEGGRRRRAAWEEWGGGARLPGASGGGAAAVAVAFGGQGHSWKGTLAGGALRP
ncbi:hypothetical protein E2C01_063865 [Portunus trituberculatus]|uniref:Uncharacterized protein n=1 Tax=Portunus trituberculatus TaxID=210409 RepID=A0A5B7HJC2_PORTR|nr:hypothetical protein [Portunus trituberculatus]